MDKNSPVSRLFIFLILVTVGLILGMFASIIPGILGGFTIEQMQSQPTILMEEGSSGVLRLSLFINHLFLFLLPSLVYGIIVFGKDILRGFDLDRIPSVSNIIISIAFLLLAYPLVNLAHYINLQIPLADWMISNEQNVAAMLTKIIDSTNPLILFFNILLVAVMPAIGEELVFRGIIQKNLEKWTKNGHISIWIAAAIFSGIHWQFEGFLARMVLGAIMGYSYYLTRNFWVPIILHFLNNLIPLIVFVGMDIDLTKTEGFESKFNWYSLMLSIIGIPLIIYLFKKINGKREIIES